MALQPGEAALPDEDSGCGITSCPAVPGHGGDSSPICCCAMGQLLKRPPWPWTTKWLRLLPGGPYGAGRTAGLAEEQIPALHARARPQFRPDRAGSSSARVDRV
jgi:hypothetical protein